MSKRPVHVRCTQEDGDLLESLGNGNRTEGLHNLIEDSRRKPKSRWILVWMALSWVGWVGLLTTWVLLILKNSLP